MTPAAARALSVAFGFAMVATAAVEARGLALAVAISSVAAVLLGLRFRVAATAAVLLAATALVLSDASPVASAMCGLCAAGYLVLRYSATVEYPAAVTAVGLAAAVLAAIWFAPELPWLPLLAPVAVIGIYTLAVRPFLHDWARRLALDGWRS